MAVRPDTRMVTIAAVAIALGCSDRGSPDPPAAVDAASETSGDSDRAFAADVEGAEVSRDSTAGTRPALIGPAQSCTEDEGVVMPVFGLTLGVGFTF